MNFSTIHANFPSKRVPLLPIMIGLFISILISHRDNLVAGLFMGWFYGYAAIGNYSALKKAIISYRNK